MALLNSLQRPNPTVCEFGGFLGHTSLRLAQAMASGTLIIAEYDPEAPERAHAIETRLIDANLPKSLNWQVLHSDALTVIGQLPDESVDLCYLDDDHQSHHVHEEITRLLPKIRPGGLICGHDVYGSCQLHEVFTHFGGYSLDLPRLGAAGGLGILQIR